MTKGAKKEKDPNEPKRAQTAWMFWLQENGDRLREEAKASDDNWMKLGGEEWKAIGDKSKWEELAAEDRERYRQEKGEPSPEPEKSSAKKKPAAATTTSSKPVAKGAKASGKK